MLTELLATLLAGTSITEVCTLICLHRSNKKRAEAEAKRAESEAEGSEFSVLRDTTVFLQEQLSEKEVRFAQQTEQVRTLTTQVLDLTRANGDLKVTLERSRCDDLPCPFRMPPNAYTVPNAKSSREAYIRATRQVGAPTDGLAEK